MLELPRVRGSQRIGAGVVVLWHDLVKRVAIATLGALARAAPT